MLEVCFEDKKELRILNLSGTNLRQLPSTIEELSSLKELLLRGCTNLEVLPNIRKLENLEVIDVSGSTKLEKNEGSLFQEFSVPAKLHSLTKLLLRNCNRLSKLPNLKPLSSLQILDLSGCCSLVKMPEVCFEDKKELRILNLSGTNLRQLPSTIEELSSLNELLLRGCTNLEVITNIQKLENLEVIDVSGSTKLEKIEGSLMDLSYLREVNLSGTKLETLELPMGTRVEWVKHVTLADGRHFEGKYWTHVREKMSNVISENASSSDGSVDFPVRRGISMEGFGQLPIYRALYQKSMPFVDSESHPKVLEIHGSHSLVSPCDLDKEALANAKFVSFVDTSSARLTSVFNENKSVKGCWLRMCKDIEYLFSGVDEESLGSLEILSITNLRLFGTICSGGSFKNLKKLSVDCCPNIKTLFLEASQLPSNLEVLHIRFCEKLETVFKEGQVSTLVTLTLHELPVLSAVGAKLPNIGTFKVRNCPKLEKVFEEEGQVSTLTTLCLYELPVLSEVLAQLPNLEIFSKRNCPNLYATKEMLQNSGSDCVFEDRIEASPQD